MDDDGFPLRDDRTVRGVLSPGRLDRLAARLRSTSLDEALIAGADPARSPQLAARAMALTSTRSRSSLADGLERLLEIAQGPPSRWRVLARRAVVVANASELRDLATLLRGGSPLYARGIAVVNQLLTDGSGPAYTGDGAAFGSRLHEARASMCGA